MFIQHSFADQKKSYLKCQNKTTVLVSLHFSKRYLFLLFFYFNFFINLLKDHSPGMTQFDHLQYG